MSTNLVGLDFHSLHVAEDGRYSIALKTHLQRMAQDVQVKHALSTDKACLTALKTTDPGILRTN